MQEEAVSVERLHSGKRMSQVVVHGNTVYLAGQVAEEAAGKTAGEQMREILARIDRLLGEAGCDRSKLLSATIWLADMRDYDGINAVWDAWIPSGGAPARACVEARLPAAKYTVEVAVIAAR